MIMTTVFGGKEIGREEEEHLSSYFYSTTTRSTPEELLQTASVMVLNMCHSKKSVADIAVLFV